MPIFIDKSVVELEKVWCGGGSRSQLIRLKTNDIIALTNGKIGEFSISEK